MTSGEDWQSDIKEEGDNESMLVDVESHEDLPNMKTETEDSFLDQVRTHDSPQPSLLQLTIIPRAS